MKSRAHIRERDAVLQATDALTYAILGQAWSFDAHRKTKGQLLDIIDNARIVRTLADGTQFMGDK
jgi:hypothetical protein